jgi:hypothetical protein
MQKEKKKLNLHFPLPFNIVWESCAFQNNPSLLFIIFQLFSYVIKISKN